MVENKIGIAITFAAYLLLTLGIGVVVYQRTNALPGYRLGGVYGVYRGQ